MKPYVDWKRTIGRKTTIVTTNVTGTSAESIKNYIANYYNNPNNNSTKFQSRKNEITKVHDFWCGIFVLIYLQGFW